MRNTPPPPRRVRSAHESKSAAVRAAAAAPSRRQQSKWRREQHQQRTLFLAIGALAVLVGAILAGGLVYDNVVRANATVAEIGPERITASRLVDEMQPALRQLDAQVKQIGDSGRQNVSQFVVSQKRELPDQTLNDLIDRYLIQQAADQRGLTVSSPELEDKQRQTVADFQAATNPVPTVDPATAEVAATPQLTPGVPPTLPARTTPTPIPTLDTDANAVAQQDLLDRNGLSESDFRDRLRENALREKVQTAIAEEQVPATQEQVHAQHILVPTEEQARDVLTRLNSGEAFADVARQLSTDPGSKDKGGDLGWFGRGVMDKPFEDAAFALQPGQRSDVVKGANGYHIIEVLERDASRAVAADQLESQRQKAFSDWLATRRSSPDVKLSLGQSERDWVLSRIGVRP